KLRPPNQQPSGSPGYVISERPDLVEGELTTKVHLNRRAVVLLSASYDPGWTVTVNSKPAQTEMVAPALVGVTLNKGTYTVRFLYQADPYYPEFFAMLAVGILGLGFGPGVYERYRNKKTVGTGDKATSSI
ncbi:MAG: YfhO family protein, partial [Firmicutes bacterium]|nr:YfhO family protein [Bacillota bacterium]